VGRFLRGESTIVRPLRWPMKLWRTLRRRRAAVAVVVLVLAAIVLTGVIVSLLHSPVGFPAVASMDPDAALHEIQKELAAGKPVTLVGETGPPRWFNSVHGGGGAVTEPGLNDGTFAIQSLDQAFIELLPDPFVERYRFSAEVRQDKPEVTGVGRVGVYFCRHTYESDSSYRPFHALRLEFADEDLFKQPPLPPTGRLGLMACLIVAPSGSPEKVPAVGCGGHDFSPATSFPGPWRKLVVEVRPDKIMPYWWNEKSNKLELVEKGLDANGLKFVTQSLQQEADKLKDLPSAPRTIADFQPRSGLGLYAFRSKASFRNVVIEPLPPDQ
jgi:hypothetical protein